MATVTATLPTMGSTFTETSSSTTNLTAGLPVLTTHLSSGMTTTPPALTGTAVVRALSGTATAT